MTYKYTAIVLVPVQVTVECANRLTSLVARDLLRQKAVQVTGFRALPEQTVVQSITGDLSDERRAPSRS